ncbi:DUF6538 domain-containing protein, partial [Tianweitania sp.]|uniref:DUF6538 domain-containing protein n=1 Tax=Tianweitania sp. TaxID=2021634 RepID=UPI00289637B1
MLKHVQKRGQTWRYRRKVPEELRPAIGKRELTYPLGSSEAEAARRYHKVNAEAERALDTARRSVAVKEGLLSPRPATDLERHDLTRKRLRELGFDPDGEDFEATWAGREAERDRIAAKYPEDPETGYPLDVSVEDAALAGSLASSSPLPPPTPSLEDAKRLYVKDRLATSQSGLKTQRRNELRAERVVKYVTDALGRDPKLKTLRRADARKVQEAMLGAIGSPATVDRYLNDLRAIINHAAREFELEGFRNPFASLEAPAGGGVDLARTKRRPFSVEELKAVRERLIGRNKQPEIKLIWRLLEGTGCRLAEVTGLRVQDVHTEADLPYVEVTWHEDRRVKTAASHRWVPLIGDALEAAKEAVEAAKGRALVFPRYATENGPNSASAALMKHVRKIVADAKVSTHSLRHNMKDRLRAAAVPSSVQDM